MATKKEHDRKNSVTDIDRRGIYYSDALGMSYQGLPRILCRISNILFILICNRVRYSSGKVKKGFDHISNVNPITVDTILKNAKPIAYSEGKKIEGDRKNYRKYFSELHKNNIFYVWKCGKFYVFIMEREIRSWLIYNKEGCVTPKTIMKIITRARGIINDMKGFHSDFYGNMNDREIESSFGFFMNGMIHKMNPLIASEGLPTWNKSKHIYEHLSALSDKLFELEEFDGLTDSDDYINRLPEYSRKIVEKVSGGNRMNADIKEEIVPSGKAANLGKPMRKSRKKAKESTGKVDFVPQKPQKARFDKGLNPFYDSKSFSKYYRASLQQISGSLSIRFDDIKVDNRMATEVLDLLKEYGLEKKEFLDDWIKYFFDNDLKGDKGKKPENTSLSTFRYTFERYKENHYIPQ